MKAVENPLFLQKLQMPAQLKNSKRYTKIIPGRSWFMFLLLCSKKKNKKMRKYEWSEKYKYKRKRMEL